MEGIPVDDFWERFDAENQEVLTQWFKAPFDRAYELNPADYPRQQPASRVLQDLGKQTFYELLDLFPEAHAVWIRMREPNLDVRPARQLYRVLLADGTRMVVRNPCFSFCAFEYVPWISEGVHGRPGSPLARARFDPFHHYAFMPRGAIRVIDDVGSVVREVSRYVLHPYLMNSLLTEDVESRFLNVLTGIFGRRHAQFDATMPRDLHFPAERELYASSAGDPRRLMNLILRKA